MENRIKWIDMLKGLLILFVVFGHGVQGLVSNSALTTNTDYRSLVIMKEFIYSFHMPAFFFVSGLFAKNIFLKEKIIDKKIRRLVYPYFLWSLITSVFMQFASGTTNNGLGLKDFFLSPIIPFSQYWFLYNLFIIFIIHFLIGKIFEYKSDKILLYLSIILFFVSPFVPNIWILNQLCSNLIYYSIGVLSLNPIKSNVNLLKNKKYILINLTLFLIAESIYLSIYLSI